MTQHETGGQAAAIASVWSAPPSAGGIAILVMVAVLVYLPPLWGGFILDDELLTQNKLIKAGDGLFRIWCTTEPVDYWPVTNSSFWLEWRLWGNHPAGYHLTNLLLHLVNVVLIWMILARLSIPGAYLAALLFAVHPVNVESVAWIAQRKNVLSLLFFLLSVLWYLKSDETSAMDQTDEKMVGSRLRAASCHAASLLFFVLAMLGKGSAAALPAVLLLIAWWRYGRIGGLDVVKAAPFFAIAVGLSAVNVWFQTHGSGEVIRSVTIWQRFAGAGAAIWFYLLKALVPIRLLFVYPQWEINAADWRWWLPLAAALAVTGILLWQRNSRWGRSVLFAWLFFCVGLLPALGLVDVNFMKYSLVADHYQYIAILGPIALAAGTITYWSRTFRHAAQLLKDVLCIGLVMLLAVFALKQSYFYADGIALYKATLDENPDCWMLQNDLGLKLLRANRFDEAIAHLQKAIELNPDYAAAENNLGLALFNSNRPDAAIREYRRAIELRPDYPEAHSNLGNALLRLGRRPEAIEAFQTAIRFAPDHFGARNNLGIALAASGDRQAAIEQFEQVVKNQPNYADAWGNLASTLAADGRQAEAVDAARRAVELARAQGQTALAARIEERVMSYGAREKTPARDAQNK